jgi:hypothetical protein
MKRKLYARILSLVFAWLILTATGEAQTAISSCNDMKGFAMEEVTYLEFDTNALDPRADHEDAARDAFVARTDLIAEVDPWTRVDGALRVARQA